MNQTSFTSKSIYKDTYTYRCTDASTVVLFTMSCSHLLSPFLFSFAQPYVLYFPLFFSVSKALRLLFPFSFLSFKEECPCCQKKGRMPTYCLTVHSPLFYLLPHCSPPSIFFLLLFLSSSVFHINSQHSLPPTDVETHNLLALSYLSRDKPMCATLKLNNSAKRDLKPYIFLSHHTVKRRVTCYGEALHNNPNR